MIKYTRREILVGSLLTATGVAATLCVGCSANTPDEEVLSPLRIYLKRLEGVDVIGLDQLEKASGSPAMNHVAELTERLTSHGDLDSIDDIASAVDRSIQSDYMQNHLCNVSEWRLSKTECLLASAKVALFGVSATVAETPSFENAPQENFLSVQNWGPKTTRRGMVFNQQTDGHCGIWFKIKNAPPYISVYIEGRSKKTVVGENIITSGIYPKDLDQFINTVGKKEIFLYDKVNNRKQYVGAFEVAPGASLYKHADGAESKVFCVIDAWGPKVVSRGEPFNLQPGGDSAFWITMQCAPKTARLYLDESPLPTAVQGNTVTARIASTLVEESGTHLITLRDEASRESVLVGEFTVH